MQALDDAVEPWLFSNELGPVGALGQQRSIVIRWAIKTAMMRALVDGDSPLVPRADYEAIRLGKTPESWFVFVGNVHSRVIVHSSGHFGFERSDGTPAGLLQASWALGLPVIVVFRSDLEGASHSFLAPFRELTAASIPLAEITAGADPGMTLFSPVNLPPLFTYAADAGEALGPY